MWMARELTRLELYPRSSMIILALGSRTDCNASPWLPSLTEIATCRFKITRPWRTSAGPKTPYWESKSCSRSTRHLFRTLDIRGKIFLGTRYYRSISDLLSSGFVGWSLRGGEAPPRGCIQFAQPRPLLSADRGRTSVIRGSHDALPSGTAAAQLGRIRLKLWAATKSIGIV